MPFPLVGIRCRQWSGLELLYICLLKLNFLPNAQLFPPRSFIINLPLHQANIQLTLMKTSIALVFPLLVAVPAMGAPLRKRDDNAGTVAGSIISAIGSISQ